MASTDQHICVEHGTKCSDGVVRYRIRIKNERIIVKRFNDFKEFDAGLGNVPQKPTLPAKGWFGFRKEHDLFKFNEARREGLEVYLNKLCAGSSGQKVNAFLTETAVSLYNKSAAELELYSTAELKGWGLSDIQLIGKGRTEEFEKERSKERLDDYNYSPGESDRGSFVAPQDPMFNGEELEGPGSNTESELVLSKELPVQKAVQVFGKDRVVQCHLFSTYDLKECGFTAKELKDHQYKNIDIWEAGYSMNELNEAGISMNQAFEDVSPTLPKPKPASCFQFLSCGCLPCGG